MTLTAADEVVGLEASSGEVRTLWRHPGHGMSDGFQGLRGLASIDEDGDGVRRSLVATAGPEHCARMVAVGVDGRVAWYRDFEMFRHRPVTIYYEGLLHWEAGRFFGRKGEDLLACFRWYAPTVEGHGVRGDTRETVWERNHSVAVSPTVVREFGDRMFSTVDRGGRDDIVSGSPDVYYVADGRTGEVVTERMLVKGTFPIVPEGQRREADWWVAYHVPIVVDLDGDGAPEVILGGGPNLTAALRLDGAPIWHGEHAKLKPNRPMPGVGDVDGDGRLEVGAWEPDRRFVCFDGATGKVRWTWAEIQALPSHVTSITTCDVDGDGLEEFVVPMEKELIAFNGKGGKANVIWRMPLPAACREAVAADADGDGRAEVLMACSDGYLYCVK